LVREHLESIPQLVANLRKSRETSEEPTQRTFPCTGCSRVFYSEQELTRHWYGRHGRSVNGEPDRPSRSPSPELSALLAQFEAMPRSPSPPEKNHASSEAGQSEAFGLGSATWNSGTHKFRRGGGPDRGYSNVENRRMAKRARLLSEATAKPLSPAEPYRGSPVEPPVKRADGGVSAGNIPSGIVEDCSPTSRQQAQRSPSIWEFLKIKKARTFLAGLLFGRACGTIFSPSNTMAQTGDLKKQPKKASGARI
jgi:hypothetical protein